MEVPGELDRFIGRAEQLAQIAALFAGGARLVTLVGLPGVGKTRLALQAHHDARARGIQVALESNGVDELHGAELLVVDAVEASDARAVSLLAALKMFPKLSVLATSGGPLGIGGEILLPIEPLRLPEPGADPALSEAVELLLDRARGAGNFDLDPSQAAELARWFEGIPLALELVARRLLVLQPDEPLMRRDHPPELLRALDAAIAKLPEPLLSVLAQLSVFEEGFTPEAAEAVIDRTALGSLAALRTRGLIGRSSAHATTPPRLSLMRPVKLAARALASRLGILEAAEARHASWFSAQAARRGNDRDALAWVASETGNLRAAAQRSLQSPSAQTRNQGLIALLAFEDLVHIGGMFAGLVALLDLALAERAGVSPELLVRSLDARARLRDQAGEIDGPLADSAEATALAGRLGDERLSFRCSMTSIWLLRHRNGLEACIAAWSRILSEARERRDGLAEARALLELACIEQERQRHTQAHRLLLQALDRARTGGFLALEITTLGRLAENLVEQNRPREALPLLDAGLSLVGSLGHAPAKSILMGVSGLAYHLSGDLAQARRHYLHARDLFDAVWSAPYTELLAELGLALVALEGKQALLARRHFERALQLARVAAPQAEAIAWLVETALSPELSSRLAELRPLMEQALAGSVRPWLRYARFSFSILDRIANGSKGPRLRLGADMRSFSLDGGPSVSLARRASLRRILGHLAQLRREMPGHAATADALFVVGWPGIRARPGSARSRVYVALGAVGLAAIRAAGSSRAACRTGSRSHHPYAEIPRPRAAPATPRHAPQTQRRRSVSGARPV